MKNDREIMEKVRCAIDDCTRGIDEAPSLRCQILTQAKGEKPVKKKLSLVLALAMVMMLLVSGALAATLLNSDVLGWLFRNKDAEVPQEVIDLVDTPNQTYTGDAVTLTLKETFFDGHMLTVGFTMQNTTDETLLCTISHAELNGRPLVAESTLLPYGGTHGQALGGEVEGRAIPAETRVIATFFGLGSQPASDGLIPMSTPAPLQAMDGAELSVLLEVYRPLLPLDYLAPGECVNETSALTAQGLAIEQENNLVPLQSGYMEKVEERVLTFPIRMEDAALTTVNAVPGVYENGLFSINLEEFRLSATSGSLKGRITVPSPVAVKGKLPDDLSFFYIFAEDVYETARENNDPLLGLNIRTQSGAGYVDPESAEPAVFDVEASLSVTAGELPRGVYLVWMTDNNGVLDWDTAIHIPME